MRLLRVRVRSEGRFAALEERIRRETLQEPLVPTEAAGRLELGREAVVLGREAPHLRGDGGVAVAVVTGVGPTRTAESAGNPPPARAGEEGLDRRFVEGGVGMEEVASDG